MKTWNERNNEEKKQLMQSVFSNGIEFYENAYEINGQKLTTEEVNDMCECVQRMLAKEFATDINVGSNGWIPVTYHVATDEEREEMCLSHDIAYILDCPMPDDEQEIIVCNERYVWTDTCMIDEGYSLDSGNDWCGDVVAWMPMPKKYEPKKQKGE